MILRMRRCGSRFSPTITGAVFFAALRLTALARAADDDVPLPSRSAGADPLLHSVLIIACVLGVLILAAIAIIVWRKAIAVSHSDSPEIEPSADPLAVAAAAEKRGNFSEAASSYETGGEKLKAAECWEKGKDFARAAEAYEAAGDPDRAAQSHVRAGGALRAAGIYMRSKNYIEAAKIFRNKGDHLRAAQALELFGNKLAAAREYTAAGNHAHAARLLEEERQFAEAAAAYQPLLGGDEVTADNADRYSTYAALLALAGDKEHAIATYRRVLDAVPTHPLALAALQNQPPPSPATAPGKSVPLSSVQPPHALATTEVEGRIRETGTPPPASSTASRPSQLAPSLFDLAREIEKDTSLDQDDPLKRVFTLRSMIQAGRMEPRYSMRLWVQVMRVLAERHGANKVSGCLTPDAIVIDMENNVLLETPAAPRPEYQSPEVRAGLPPDRQADIYSMGVILYELVCGSLEHFRSKRAGSLFSDVPSWLDELIERCTETDLAKRYRTAEEVSTALLRLKQAARE